MGQYAWCDASKESGRSFVTKNVSSGITPSGVDGADGGRARGGSRRGPGRWRLLQVETGRGECLGLQRRFNAIERCGNGGGSKSGNAGTGQNGLPGRGQFGEQVFLGVLVRTNHDHSVGNVGGECNRE